MRRRSSALSAHSSTIPTSGDQQNDSAGHQQNDHWPRQAVSSGCTSGARLNRIVLSASQNVPFSDPWTPFSRTSSRLSRTRVNREAFYWPLQFAGASANVCTDRAEVAGYSCCRPSVRKGHAAATSVWHRSGSIPAHRRTPREVRQFWRGLRTILALLSRQLSTMRSSDGESATQLVATALSFARWCKGHGDRG